MEKSKSSPAQIAGIHKKLASLGIDNKMIEPFAKSLNPLSSYNHGFKQQELPALKKGTWYEIIYENK